jgi:hypothetical protein
MENAFIFVHFKKVLDKFYYLKMLVFQLKWLIFTWGGFFLEAFILNYWKQIIDNSAYPLVILQCKAIINLLKCITLALIDKV